VLGNVKEPLDLTLRQGDLAVVDKVKDLPNLHLGHVLRHQEHWVSCCCGGEGGEEAPEVGRYSAEDHLVGTNRMMAVDEEGDIMKLVSLPQVPEVLGDILSKLLPADLV